MAAQYYQWVAVVAAVGMAMLASLASADRQLEFDLPANLAGGGGGGGAWCDCPDSTFRVIMDGKPYCACPFGFDCEGCSRACTGDAMDGSGATSWRPWRCVQGFYQSACMAATCYPKTDDRRAGGGVMVDRRTSHKCNATHTDATLAPGDIVQLAAWMKQQGTAFTAESAAEAMKDFRLPIHIPDTAFVFTVSTGHTATAYLASHSTWSGLLTDPNRLEGTLSNTSVTHEHFTHNRGVAQLRLHPNYCQVGLHYIREYWWPWCRPQLAPNDKHGRITTWFDTGHLVSMSVATAYHTFLGNQARFVRLRRNRIDVAWSKTKSSSLDSEEAQDRQWPDPEGTGSAGANSRYGRRTMGGPCSDYCTWCMCPLDAATLCLPPGSIWDKLTFFQQFLWEIDELECQWKSLVSSRKGLQHMAVDWDESITAEDLKHVADFAGLGSLDDAAVATHVRDNKRKKKNKAGLINDHAEGSAVRNETDLALQDKEYRQLLGLRACNTFYCDV